MSKERLIVIGGDAAGIRSAFQTRRLNSDPKNLVFKRDRYTSYSA